MAADRIQVELRSSKHGPRDMPNCRDIFGRYCERRPAFRELGEELAGAGHANRDHGMRPALQARAAITPRARSTLPRPRGSAARDRFGRRLGESRRGVRSKRKHFPVGLPDWLTKLWRGHPLWQLEADGARTWLENEVTRMEHAPDRVDDPVERQILDGYRQAMTVAVTKEYTSLAERLTEWRSGAAIEQAWRSFHGANQTLLLLQPVGDVRARLPEIGAALRASLRSDDARLGPYTERINALQAAADADLSAARTELRTMLAAADSTSDTAHADIRSWRNLLALVGSSLTFLLLFIACLHAIVPSFLPLTAPISHAGETPEVWEIELFGVLGGGLAAVVALIRIQGFSGAYRLPVYQAAFRLPVGMATGLVAVMLLQGSLFDAVSPQRGSKLLAYAVTFGFAQEAVLRFLDRKADRLLGAARTQNDPQTKQAVPAG